MEHIRNRSDWAGHQSEIEWRAREPSYKSPRAALEGAHRPAESSSWVTRSVSKFVCKESGAMVAAGRARWTGIQDHLGSPGVRVFDGKTVLSELGGICSH